VTEPGDLTAEQFQRWWKEAGEGELRQILFWRWDPIGVSDQFPATADEYDGYAPGIAALLRLGVEEEALAEHLAFVERELMGLPKHRDRAGTARFIAWWFETSVAKWADSGRR
jgi:hypothetical protein